MQKLLFFLVLNLILCCTFGCGGDEPEKSKPNVTHPESEPEKVEPIIDIASVNLYVENSMSMGGYYEAPDSEFRSNLSNLVTQLSRNNNFGTNLKTFLISKKSSVQEVDLYKLIRDNNKKLRGGSSSQIHDMLNTVFEKSEENDVNLFITDGILSLPDPSDIRNVKNDIINAIKDKASYMSIKILAFDSAFDGRYYYNKFDNKNSGHKKIRGIMPSRPYYIFLLGKPKLIKKFEDKMHNYLEPKEKLEIGYNTEVASENFKTERCFKDWKNCRPAKNRNEITFNKKNTFQFGVATDFSSLDRTFQKKSFLEKNLKLKINNEINNKAIFKVFDVKNDLETTWKNPRCNELDENLTHLLSVQLNDFDCKDISNMSIELNQNIIEWNAKWHAEDDTTIDNSFDKTYAFKHLIDGLIETYSSKPNTDLIPIFNFELKPNCK